MTLAEFAAVVKVAVDQPSISKAKADLKGFGNGLGTFFDNLGAGIGHMLTRVLGPLAILHSLLNFGQGVFHAALLGNELNNMSQIVNVGTESLQGLIAAAGNVNVETYQVEVGLRRLSFVMNKAKEGTKGFADILPGRWWEDANGKTLTATKMMMKLADIMNAMPASIEKTAKMHVLLGRTGERLEPLLNKGSKGISAYDEKLRRLGVTMDREGIAKSVQLNAAVQDLHLAWQGFEQSLAGGFFTNVLTGVLRGVTWFIAKATSAVNGFKDGTNSARWVFVALGGVASLVLGTIILKLIVIAAMIWPVTLAFLALTAVVIGVGLIFEDLWTGIKGGKSVFFDLAKEFTPIGDLAADLLDLVMNITDVSRWRVLGDDIVKMFKWAFEKVKDMARLIPGLDLAITALETKDAISKKISKQSRVTEEAATQQVLPRDQWPDYMKAKITPSPGTLSSQPITSNVNVTVNAAPGMTTPELASHISKEVHKQQIVTLKNAASGLKAGAH
jgi:hypothetical protein